MDYQRCSGNLHNGEGASVSLWRATYIRDGGRGKITFSASSKVRAQQWAYNFITPLRRHWKDAELLEVLPVVQAPVQERLGL